MDWIVTTARTVEEARTRALDLLGVDSADAEVQVMEEGKTGLFGRTKSEARVRARIKPKAPPVKDERRPSRGGGDRNRNRGGGGGNNRGGNRSGGGKGQGNRGGGGGNNRGGDRNGGGGNRNKGAAAATAGAAAAASSGDGGNRNSGGDRNGGGGNRKPRNRGGNRSGGGRQGGNDSRRNEDREEMPVEEQRETLETFAKGVAAAFDVDANIELVEEGTNLEVQVRGEDLGRLVGSKASTLQAFEELARTAMHRAAAGRRYHRIRVDVDEYRERRRKALARFATDLAEQVAASGESKAMEPMNAPDRKLVHDAVADIAGVETVSEGRDPRRYIVLMPASVDGDEEE